eukprot:scaffold132475_cov63-Phaeocystis_antarctica.AAC.1
MRPGPHSRARWPAHGVTALDWPPGNGNAPPAAVAHDRVRRSSSVRDGRGDQMAWIKLSDEAEWKAVEATDSQGWAAATKPRLSAEHALHRHQLSHQLRGVGPRALQLAGLLDHRQHLQALGQKEHRLDERPADREAPHAVQQRRVGTGGHRGVIQGNEERHARYFFSRAAEQHGHQRLAANSSSGILGVVSAASRAGAGSPPAPQQDARDADGYAQHPA